jgi:UDP-N-acetylglucosamine 2-epimerase (non-hydrolysing)
MEMKKTVVSITGIRPDFIRMSNVFKELDNNFRHILIHTGQHYNPLLSNVFFEQLNIRKPDFILETGKSSTNHYEQLAYLSVEIPKLFEKHNIKPDLIVFLGDSNSAGLAFPLKKEGYKICHIEAGMRSYDKRMLEEINRTVCDHCSDILFVYHEDYKKQLELENIKNNVYVVGNTIVEPVNLFKKSLFETVKTENFILMDIHRPENFNYEDRLKNIMLFGNECFEKYKIPVKLLFFPRLKSSLERYNINLGNIDMIELLPFNEYLEMVYNCKFLISDSGTGQEEPALLNTKVIVPRDYTERPQSFINNCSFQLKVNSDELNFNETHIWLERHQKNEISINTKWLGDGETSKKIIKELINFLN